MNTLRTLVLLMIVVLPSWAWAVGPVVVTTVRGEVTLASGEALGAPPALVPAGQTLTVAVGVGVVVLWQGAALKFEGPCVVDPAELQAPDEGRTAQASALQGLLTRQGSTSRPAASRGAGSITLARPVAGLPLLSLGDVRWSCDGCGEIDVVVEDAREESVVWSTHGDGLVSYDGPALEPGSYYLRLGGVDHLFRVTAADHAAVVAEALSAADAVAATLPAADPAARVGIVAAVLLHEGLITDALYRVDQALRDHPEDPHLEQLLDDFETRAGLRK